MIPAGSAGVHGEAPDMLRRLVILALFAISLAPGTTPAAHWIDCGGSWQNSGTSCEFSIRGLPVQLSGFAESSGEARIHVWLTIATPTGPLTIAECASNAAGYATCADEFGVGEFVDPFVQTLPMTCHVEGRGAGRYTCASYAGPGT